MKDQSAFKPGDAVILASGGPIMNVVDIGQHTGRVFCEWTKGNGDTAEASFPAACLKADCR
jgi:uncharacterized protein YodC (DUF2158 family)